MSAGVLALQIGAGIATYELIRYLVVRRIRTVVRTGAVQFVRRHRIQLESARFIDRLWIREALAQDPRIEAAVARIARETDHSVVELHERVDAYVEEIAPFFSLSAYYRLGSVLAKRVIGFLFEMVVERGGFEEQVAAVPKKAVRVYVINHRANMDPLILAYGLLRHVPMSYAVGEWALVWPLHTLFRSFGSYFVRRGELDPLYHAVLERFIQLLAGQGAVTGFFIEGGLTRDGALRRPRTGLLDYIIGLRHDQPERDIAFMPVGLNYDRVFEDRILVRRGSGSAPAPTRAERLENVISILVSIPSLILANLLRVATRSHRKFGYAAIEFGEPLLLSEWPGGSELHTLPDEPRRAALDALGEELLLRRVGAVIPATPVALLCEALRRGGDDDWGALRRRVQQVIAELRAVGAPLALGAAFQGLLQPQPDDLPSIHEAFDAQLAEADIAERIGSLASQLLLRRGVLRRVLTPTGDGVEIVAGFEDIVSYYANSIRHHLAPAVEPSAGQ
ncbi:MAG TPA: hypothetical protein ENK18_26100 [Deltaproteobacteria bacterium]|nr:hypothetical protein [Deltaproteobacteria bacterium]